MTTANTKRSDAQPRGRPSRPSGGDPTKVTRHTIECSGRAWLLHPTLDSDGAPITTCERCARVSPGWDPDPETGRVPEVPRRYLTCIDCEGSIPVKSSRPRVPICSTCADQRVQGGREAREARRNRDAARPFRRS